MGLALELSEIISKIEALKKQRYDGYITVKGLKVRYTIMGAGMPVILLHGFGAFLETWAFNVPPLSRRYQVYVLDLPGHGLSDKPKDGYSLKFATEFTISLLEAG